MLFSMHLVRVVNVTLLIRICTSQYMCRQTARQERSWLDRECNWSIYQRLWVQAISKCLLFILASSYPRIGLEFGFINWDNYFYDLPLLIILTQSVEIMLLARCFYINNVHLNICKKICIILCELSFLLSLIYLIFSAKMQQTH